MNKLKTTDLADRHEAQLQFAEPIFKDYGGVKSFAGPIVTVRVYEDNPLVRQLTEQPGRGRVLVVDGGGSLRRALVGGNIAAQAYQNGWVGLVVYGCIRDSDELSQIPMGVKALNTIPLRPLKSGKGETNVPVTFAGITFYPGRYVYGDEDGLVVSEHQLTLD